MEKLIVVVAAGHMHILRLPFLFVPLILRNLVSLHEDHNNTDHLEIIDFIIVKVLAKSQLRFVK